MASLPRENVRKSICSNNCANFRFLPFFVSQFLRAFVIKHPNYYESISLLFLHRYLHSYGSRLLHKNMFFYEFTDLIISKYLAIGE